MRTMHKIWCWFVEPDGEAETIPFMGKTRDTAFHNAELYIKTYKPAGTSMTVLQEGIIYTGGKRRERKQQQQDS